MYSVCTPVFIYITHMYSAYIPVYRNSGFFIHNTQVYLHIFQSDDVVFYITQYITKYITKLYFCILVLL